VYIAFFQAIRALQRPANAGKTFLNSVFSTDLGGEQPRGFCNTTFPEDFYREPMRLGSK
jgi:hypothetical protein